MLRKSFLVAAMLMVAPASVQPPEDSNPAYSPFFHDLVQPPTSKYQPGHGCCDKSDCRTVDARLTKSGQWEAFLDRKSFGPDAPDDWVLMPDRQIVRDPPEGRRPLQAIVCWKRGDIYCFTEPAPGI